MTLPTTTRPTLERQPYLSTVRRVVTELANAGSPLPDDDLLEIQKALDSPDADLAAVEKRLAPRVLLHAAIDRHGYATLQRGDAIPQLVEKGWTNFLVRIENPSALVGPLHLASNPVGGFHQRPAPGEFTEGLGLAQIPWNADRIDKAGLVEDSWLRFELGKTTSLSGLPLEYAVVHLYSSVGSDRTGSLGLSAVADPIGLHAQTQVVSFDFLVSPSFDVQLDIRDEGGRTCFAGIIIRDAQGRVYPPQAMRVAPDMRFQPQIYRGSGETVKLPAGTYTYEARRGPEYLVTHGEFTVLDGTERVQLRLERWVAPEAHGWFSGDPHLHAAGCSHYLSPTEGVKPETMIRQVRGEGLGIGQVLAWGPGYYYQRQFFSGAAISPPATLEYPALQNANNQSFTTATTETDPESALRYDVEVSGFPSSHLGHVMLLDLKDQDFPGAPAINDWPSWTLPVTTWARQQGATVGYAHCGFGMAVPTESLPNYEMPPFNSIGTNEAIVDVTFGVVDFLAGAEALPSMELNSWYHLLNCGYQIAMLGETDYPCIFDERPGVGRTYIQQAESIAAGTGYTAWVKGIREGRLYFGDGRSHFLRFTVDGVSTGSTIQVAEPTTLRVEATVAALLENEITAETESIRDRPAWARPAWHLERARIRQSRCVPVELVVNGISVETREIEADGSLQELTFDVSVDRSSWIALRILPSGHTHPTFVKVGGNEIRASRRSAEWCRQAIDVIWNQKARFIRDEERDAARVAFDRAREVYEAIAHECEVD